VAHHGHGLDHRPDHHESPQHPAQDDEALEHGVGGEGAGAEGPLQLLEGRHVVGQRPAHQGEQRRHAHHDRGQYDQGQEAPQQSPDHLHRINPLPW
jgi:hypothetical protein